MLTGHREREAVKAAKAVVVAAAKSWVVDHDCMTGSWVVAVATRALVAAEAKLAKLMRAHKAAKR